MGVRVNFSETYKTPVNFTILDAEGKKEACSFIAEFKRLKREEVRAGVDAARNDSDWCREVLVGWKMQDLDTKADIPFSSEALEAFLMVPGAAGVTVLTFMETVGANRQKN